MEASFRWQNSEAVNDFFHSFFFYSCQINFLLYILQEKFCINSQIGNHKGRNAEQNGCNQQILIKFVYVHPFRCTPAGQNGHFLVIMPMKITKNNNSSEPICIIKNTSDQNKSPFQETAPF